MKKHIKIIIIIAFIIICIGGISYAAYKFTANQVKYNKSGTTIKVDAALDELYGKAKKPHIGDIVNYNANSGGSYSYTVNDTDSTKNDYTGVGTATSGTFNSSDTATWKIMSINHDTGLIELMEAGSFTKTLTLKGRAGWAYCENILDKISEVYGHGTGATGARSIRVEDINKITGYKVANSKGIHSQTYTSGDYFIGLEYDNGKVKANSHTAKTYSQVKQPFTADQFYYYFGTTYLADTSNSYKMLFHKNGTTTNRTYWLASRCISFNSSSCYFYVRCVCYASLDGNDLCYSYTSYEDIKPWAVSPVVSLNSNIQLTWDSTNNRWNIN